MTTKHEPGYRPCVGIMLLNRQGHVWVGHRQDFPDEEGRGEWWQMPQGGIDPDEEPAKAALRELYEETGVRSAVIIAEAREWHRYDLPPQLVGISWGGRYRGQTQKWFAARFIGEESEVNLAIPGHKPEFDKWRWVPVDSLFDLIVPFKRDVYAKVIAEFRTLAG